MIKIMEQFLVMENYREFLCYYCGRGWIILLTRVVAIRRKAQSILQQGDGLQQNLELWDRRRMIVWCRHHGYTPLDKESTESLSRSPERFSSESRYNSTSEGGEVLERLKSCKHSLLLSPRADATTDSLLVDVTGEEDSDNPLSPHQTDVLASPLKRYGMAEAFLPASPEAVFVHDLCSKIGVRLRPVELTEGGEEEEERSDSITVYGSLVEDMLWQSSQRFMEDLLRSCLSVIFSQNRLPEEISADHVYKAIISRPEYDFLTNSYMGTLCKDTHQ